MNWKGKTIHMHTHVHAHITHTQHNDHTHVHKKMCTCAHSTIHISHTQKYLYICSQTHADTTKLCSQFNC